MAKKDTCGFLGCKDDRAEDSLMCPTHREVIRPIREELERESDPYGTRDRARGTAKRSVPRCTRPGCHNPRRPGEPMCADCAEEVGDQSDD